MKFFIVRHAEDSKKIIGGWSDIGLTRKGNRQACELRDFILAHNKEFNIGKIISSDLPRAVQTVMPLATALKLDIQENKIFRALNWGALNGLKIRQAKKTYPKIYLSSLKANETFPGGGESPKKFYQRVVDSWKYIHQHYAEGDKNVLICTHGQQFNIFLSLCDNSKWNYKTDYRVFRPCLILELDTVTKGMRLIMPLEEYQMCEKSCLQKILFKLKRLFRK